MEMRQLSVKKRRIYFFKQKPIMTRQMSFFAFDISKQQEQAHMCF